MSQPQRCVVCGYIGWDVGPRLVRLEGDKPFGVQVRCVDTASCEDRVARKANDDAK